MAEHANDVGILRERIQHHLVGIVRRPFGVQRAHFDIRKGRSHLVVKTLVAGLRLRRDDRAAGFKHHALAADHRAQSIRTLRAPGDAQEPPGDDSPAKSFIDRGPDHDIGGAGLILQRDKMTPLAVPGRCRTSTSPATQTRAPADGSFSRARPGIGARGRGQPVGHGTNTEHGPASGKRQLCTFAAMARA